MRILFSVGVGSLIAMTVLVLVVGTSAKVSEVLVGNNPTPANAASLPCPECKENPLPGKNCRCGLLAGRRRNEAVKP